jgi:hypothetical protein
MKLTRRGEIVFAISSIFTSLVVVGAVALGIGFLATHHTVIDQSTCKQVAEGTMCDFHYEGNK